MVAQDHWQHHCPCAHTQQVNRVPDAKSLLKTAKFARVIANLSI